MRPLSPGDVIAGKFRLDRVIGRGGMGAVWAARHLQLDMPVALKFIEVPEGADHDAAEARVRFEREARAIAQIRSPHVVQILDHGLDGERPFIVMELLEGEDFGERLRREGRVSLEVAARVATQSAKALRRAHEAGIIHRDLKPGNVFLARFDDDEVVKILDFGVAKMVRAGAIDDPIATQVGVVFGSPSYMSPEQARGVRALDHRTDLWSLAVILYRAITGVKPFQAATIADMVIKLCIDPLPVPTRDAPDLPPAIDRFFERAFARDPDRRFPNAAELAAAFEAAALGGAPLSISTPAPLSVSAPIAPVPISQALIAQAPMMAPPADPPPSSTGPQVAFVPSTLTPPASEITRASAGASVIDPATAPVPVAPPPIPTFIPTTPAPPPRPAAPRLLIAAGAGAFVLLGLVLLLALRGDDRAGARGEPRQATSGDPAPVHPVIPQTPIVSSRATSDSAPSAAPSASAAPEAAESAAPEAGESASAAASASAAPSSFKPVKKRVPNFGY